MPIPFEAQLNSDGQRTCGAAALNMVYKSMGIVLSQQAVWRVISLPDALGGRFSRTYRLPFDAVLRGVHAIAFKALDPIQAVQRILATGSSVIMNHRLHEDTRYGHYTVALSANDSSIEFHDPEFGPSQKRSTVVMRALWQPKFDNCEITGNFLIAVALTPAPHTCGVCGVMSPANVTCPVCNVSFALQPAYALGCVNAGCSSRLWELVLCPYCDAAFPPGA